MRIIYLLVAICLAGPANAADIYIDDAVKRDEEARRELVRNGLKICGQKKFSTVGESDACKDKYFDEARAKYPARGTDEYSEKHYAGLSRAEAEQRLTELKEIFDKTHALRATKPGQITRRQVEIEGWWIQKNILGATRTQTTPWFIECKKQAWQATVDHCPLGSGGKP